MEIRGLFADERAVPPVIGVILLVAVAVILSAVVGTFVLAVGSQVTSGAPDVALTFDFDDGGDDWTDTDDQVVITHDGGDEADRSALTTKVGGTDASSCVTSQWDDDPVTAGDSQTIRDNACALDFRSGDDVLVVWEDPDGDGSTIIGKDSVP